MNEGRRPGRSSCEGRGRRSHVGDSGSADSFREELQPHSTREGISGVAARSALRASHPRHGGGACAGQGKTASSVALLAASEARSKTRLRPVRSAVRSAPRSRDGMPLRASTRRRRWSSRQIPSKETSPARRPSSAARTRRCAAGPASSAATASASAGSRAGRCVSSVAWRPRSRPSRRLRPRARAWEAATCAAACWGPSPSHTARAYP